MATERMNEARESIEPRITADASQGMRAEVQQTMQQSPQQYRQILNQMDGINQTLPEGFASADQFFTNNAADTNTNTQTDASSNQAAINAGGDVNSNQTNVNVQGDVNVYVGDQQGYGGGYGQGCGYDQGCGSYYGYENGGYGQGFGGGFNAGFDGNGFQAGFGGGFGPGYGPMDGFAGNPGAAGGGEASDPLGAIGELIGDIAPIAEALAPVVAAAAPIAAAALPLLLL